MVNGNNPDFSRAPIELLWRHAGMQSDFSNPRPVLVIVDDDPDQLSLLQIAAERVGLFSEVITAGDGAVALKEIESLAKISGPHFSSVIILTDLKMPRVGGIELARRLCRHRRIESIALVAMSNTLYEPEVHEALAAGCCAFVQKPSGFQELKRMLLSLPELCGAREQLGYDVTEEAESVA